MYMFMYCHHDGSFANRIEICVLQTKNIYWPVKPCLSIQILIFKFSYIYLNFFFKTMPNNHDFLPNKACKNRQP